MNRIPGIVTSPCLVMALLLLTNSGCHMSHRSGGTNVISVADMKSQSVSGVVYLDIRPRADYETGHVHGARWVDLPEWVKLAKTDADGLEHFRNWQQRIAALGVGPQSVVRIYDDGSMVEAARLWFILQHFCVKQTALVNGGYRALQRELPGDRIASGPPVAVAAYAGEWPQQTCGAVELQTRADVRRCMTAKEAKILDVRTKGEYAGTDLRTNKRGGHIPSAINIPHMDLLDASGNLRSPPDLRAIFENAGLKPGDRIVAHCQSGARSSLAALALIEAGYENIGNYYLSFGDWAADETCPLEK